MKMKKISRALISLLITAIALTSCGDVFLDVNHYSTSITKVEDPNRNINPRIKRIPEPAIEKKVAAEPENFDLADLLRIYHSIGTSSIEQYYRYTVLDLKKTPEVRNENMTIGTSEFTDLNSRIENESYILTYNHDGLAFTLTQDPYGRISLSYSYQETTFEDRWITGSDGTTWHSTSQWGGRSYYEQTSDTKNPVREYHLDDQAPLKREYNLYWNGLRTELDTSFIDGKLSQKTFKSELKGNENGIEYIRNATTNELTGSLMVYEVEMKGTSAKAYADQKMADLIGNLLNFEENSEVHLSSDVFHWKLYAKASTEEIVRVLEEDGYEIVLDNERKMRFAKGDIKVEILENPGAYNMKFTFPIDDLPSEFTR